MAIQTAGSDPDERIQVRWILKLGFMHAACLMAFYTGLSKAALIAAAITLAVRIFALTGGYHRYFAHNSYKTSRVFQFMLAFIGCMSAQRGPLWWASHHRHHHVHADQPEDIHSPTLRGFFWAHLGWLLCRKYTATEEKLIPDFMKYPELRWLDRHYMVAPLILAGTLYGLGAWQAESWNTSGLQMLTWGFFISTTLLYHITFSINSVTHVWGRRRFDTTDTSRNNWLLAILAFGEGWHNNHHRYAASARNGFYWWELDITYYMIRLLALVGIVWDVRKPPDEIYAEARTLHISK